METSRTGSWLQIISNFGIVAGLFLVGFQIKQNTDLATAQQLQVAFSDSMQYSLALMGEAPAIVFAKAAF